MAVSNPTNIIQKPSFLFAYLGAFGIVVFLLLRTSFDYNAGARINHTPDDTFGIVNNVNQGLGFESDTLRSMAFRFQDGQLYRHLKEEAAGIVTPHQLNRNQIPITGWEVVLGKKYSQPDLIQGPGATFESVGYTRAKINNLGQVVYYRNHSGRNGTFLEGEAEYEGLMDVIESVFHYNAANYRPDDRDLPVFLPETDAAVPVPEAYELPASGELNLVKVNLSAAGPNRMSIAWSEAERNGNTGFQIDSFEVDYLTQTRANVESPFVIWNFTMLLIVVVLISIIILGTAIRQIFRGRMEWKRSLFIFGSITLAQLLWVQLLLHPTYYNFFDSDIVLADWVQQLFIASIYGLYGAFAYVAWESLARELRSGQIPVIDAVWGGRILKKEVGAGILTGYGIAGFYFAILAVMFFSFQLVMFQNDSNTFGFREPSTLFPAATVFLNGWLSSMLIVIAQVGVAFNLIAFVVKRESLRMAATMIVAGFTIFLIGPAFASDGSTLQVLSIYFALSIPLVMAYRYFGIVSAIVSWFVFLVGLRLLPYIGADSFFMVSQGWLLIIVLLVPFAVGLISVFYGDTITSEKAFIPEYEEKLNKRLRSEKELAIAKASQSALLPDTPPDVPGLDIHGFFVPSYEVGGDFYDFTVIRDEMGIQESLAVAIVDVSGKAMQSAFNAIFTSGLLLSRIETDSPASVLTHINPILYRKTDDQTFITCQLGRINLKTNRLELANAGHCPPILKRNGKASFIKLEEPKFPLGFRSEVRYRNSLVDLQAGDILFLYSDGFPEAQSPDGRRLSFDEVLEHIRALKTDDRSAEEISTELKNYILNFSDYELADDTTLLCVKVR